MNHVHPGKLAGHPALSLRLRNLIPNRYNRRNLRWRQINFTSCWRYQTQYLRPVYINFQLYQISLPTTHFLRHLTTLLSLPNTAGPSRNGNQTKLSFQSISDPTPRSSKQRSLCIRIISHEGPAKPAPKLRTTRGNSPPSCPLPVFGDARVMTVVPGSSAVNEYRYLVIRWQSHIGGKCLCLKRNTECRRFSECG